MQESKKNNGMPFHIPATAQEMRALKWDRPDVVLVTGDALMDLPQIGVAVVARVLLKAGYKVGVIPQPDVKSRKDITRLGEPRLFWGVTSGCLDSMVSNYTSTGKKRKSDDLTCGGKNIRRPDRAVIVYTNLIRRYFKNTAPVVLGGIEAGLRRITHFDAWSNSVRRSVLFDAKADFLIYGMAEQTILELAFALKTKKNVRSIRGLCYISHGIPKNSSLFSNGWIHLEDHEVAARNPKRFTNMFKRFYANTEPKTSRPLVQKQDSRYLIQNPPAFPLSPDELDKVHELPFTRRLHPVHEQQGPAKALETIRFSITTHRGCSGECRFCAITAHQGRRVVSRTPESIIREAARFSNHPDFKGIISDVGGPTANMYGFECKRKTIKGGCENKACLFPATCRQMPANHLPQILLLKTLRKLPRVRRVFVASGIRYDLILADKAHGETYLKEILTHHVSGQLKIAPEHSQNNILKQMGKPDMKTLADFMNLFEKTKRKTGSRVYLTYYLMAAHPGCRLSDMKALRAFCLQRLKLLPEQVQIFTPTPSTFSTLMYATETDPFTGEELFVEKNMKNKQKQKDIMQKSGLNKRPFQGNGKNKRRS